MNYLIIGIALVAALVFACLRVAQVDRILTELEEIVTRFDGGGKPNKNKTEREIKNGN